MIVEQQIEARTATDNGTLDGLGAGDHLPHRFVRKPTSSQAFAFSTHQYARLLILRSLDRSRPAPHVAERT